MSTDGGTTPPPSRPPLSALALSKRSASVKSVKIKDESYVSTGNSPGENPPKSREGVPSLVGISTKNIEENRILNHKTQEQQQQQHEDKEQRDEKISTTELPGDDDTDMRGKGSEPTIKDSLATGNALKHDHISEEEPAEADTTASGVGVQSINQSDNNYQILRKTSSKGPAGIWSGITEPLGTTANWKKCFSDMNRHPFSHSDNMNGEELKGDIRTPSGGISKSLMNSYIRPVADTPVLYSRDPSLASNYVGGMKLSIRGHSRRGNISNILTSEGRDAVQNKEGSGIDEDNRQYKLKELRDIGTQTSYTSAHDAVGFTWVSHGGMPKVSFLIVGVAPILVLLSGCSYLLHWKPLYIFLHAHEGSGLIDGKDPAWEISFMAAALYFFLFMTYLITLPAAYFSIVEDEDSRRPRQIITTTCSFIVSALPTVIAEVVVSDKVHILRKIVDITLENPIRNRVNSHPRTSFLEKVWEKFNEASELEEQVLEYQCALEDAGGNVKYISKVSFIILSLFVWAILCYVYAGYMADLMHGKAMKAAENYLRSLSITNLSTVTKRRALEPSMKHLLSTRPQSVAEMEKNDLINTTPRSVLNRNYTNNNGLVGIPEANVSSTVVSTMSSCDGQFIPVKSTDLFK
eukprot:Tbor_TRINITY_DN5475_c1_g1::TRINITY_DN5475_c1_g1_i1::g.24415::m.24415